jgi:histone acetyltransferase HTATIP
VQKACPLRLAPPPGGLIYHKENVRIYELDGAAHKLYAQNLSLFAKLFLDTKSVFYDVTTFLYYLLVLEDPVPRITNTRLGAGDAEERGECPGQVVGFFSKEKMSWDSNNLACICVFPPWQKQGWGQVLMAASYELGRCEGRMGGPEKRTFESSKDLLETGEC